MAHELVWWCYQGYVYVVFSELCQFVCKSCSLVNIEYKRHCYKTTSYSSNILLCVPLHSKIYFLCLIWYEKNDWKTLFQQLSYLYNIILMLFPGNIFPNPASFPSCLAVTHRLHPSPGQGTVFCVEWVMSIPDRIGGAAMLCHHLLCHIWNFRNSTLHVHKKVVKTQNGNIKW